MSCLPTSVSHGERLCVFCAGSDEKFNWCPVTPMGKSRKLCGSCVAAINLTKKRNLLGPGWYDAATQRSGVRMRGDAMSAAEIRADPAIGFTYPFLRRRGSRPHPLLGRRLLPEPMRQFRETCRRESKHLPNDLAPADRQWTPVHVV